MKQPYRAVVVELKRKDLRSFSALLSGQLLAELWSGLGDLWGEMVRCAGEERSQHTKYAKRTRTWIETPSFAFSLHCKRTQRCSAVIWRFHSRERHFLPGWQMLQM